MYLVELRPGKEELYRTGDELAAAIRAGDVDMHSRIYHRATSKWISVTLHPQYKAIVAERPAAPPMPPLERSTWTFFNDSADDLAGAGDASGTLDLKDGDDSDPNWRRPLALSITGGLLILGLQLAAAGPKPPWAGREARTQLPASAAVERPAPATVSYASVGNGYTESASYAPVPEESPASPPPAPPPPPRVDSTPRLLPGAPRIRTKVLLKDVLATKTTPAALAAATSPAPPRPAPSNVAPAAASKLTVGMMLQRWSSAHDSALARLESGIRVSRLSQLFTPGRLSAGGGVTETRMSLAGLANFVRVYRQQQTLIDAQYQDSFAVASKRLSWSPETVRPWYTKPARRESTTMAALTTSLIDGIDSMLGVLDAEAGTYTLGKNTIRFEDADAARRYALLRTRITATIDSARVAGGETDPGPMSYLLKAIGTTRLPIAS
jgi:hypothetical protein